jgi:hypothetical protein
MNARSRIASDQAVRGGEPDSKLRSKLENWFSARYTPPELPLLVITESLWSDAGLEAAPAPIGQYFQTLNLLTTEFPCGKVVPLFLHPAS